MTGPASEGRRVGTVTGPESEGRVVGTVTGPESEGRRVGTVTGPASEGSVGTVTGPGPGSGRSSRVAATQFPIGAHVGPGQGQRAPLAEDLRVAIAWTPGVTWGTWVGRGELNPVAR